MTQKYYRAKITLEEITPLPTDDTRSYENTRASEIAAISVTGHTPAAAMNQIVEHAQQLAAFHEPRLISKTADPWEPPLTALELLGEKES